MHYSTDPERQAGAIRNIAENSLRSRTAGKLSAATLHLQGDWSRKFSAAGFFPLKQYQYREPYRALGGENLPIMLTAKSVRKKVTGIKRSRKGVF
jgi:hypothetical protein